MKLATLISCIIFLGCSAAWAATITWVAPTHNVNGTPITDLAGFRITYTPLGQPISAGTEVDVPDPAATSYDLSNVDAQAHWFSVQAYDSAGNFSRHATQVAFSPNAAPGRVTVIVVTD